MSNSPKFSIIIPVYNVAPYLRECLDSILAQTVSNWEAICVDDGSTDGSGEILDEYAAQDARFRVVHQKNAGVSVARNRALNLARGEFITFLDSDDVVSDDFLMIFDEGFRQCDEVDWVRIGFLRWRDGDDLAKIQSQSGHLEIGRVDASDAFKWELIADRTFTWGNAYRSNQIRGVEFSPKLCICEDSLFEMSVLKCVRVVCQMDRVGYYYRLRQSSLSQVRIDYRQAIEYFSSVALLVAQIPDSERGNIAPWLSIRLAKDLPFYCEKMGVLSRAAEEKLWNVVQSIVRSGFFQYRYFREKGSGLKWWLYFHTGRNAFLRTEGGLVGLVKWIFFFLLRSEKWLYDFKGQLRRSICRQ